MRGNRYPILARRDGSRLAGLSGDLIAVNGDDIRLDTLPEVEATSAAVSLKRIVAHRRARRQATQHAQLRLYSGGEVAEGPSRAFEVTQFCKRGERQRAGPPSNLARADALARTLTSLIPAPSTKSTKLTPRGTLPRARA